MSAISDANTTFTAAQTTYQGSPTTANLQALITALSTLITAIQTQAPPLDAADQAVASKLAAFQAQLASYQADAADAAVPDVTSAANALLKHYQVSVPNFAEVTQAGTATSAGATAERTSFVRLGSNFADWTGTVTSPILQAEESSRALAGLVGDAAQITALENLTTETATSAPGVMGADASYFHGFSDDTRFRDPSETTNIDGVDKTCTKQVTQAETLKLLTKGGWWDHTDGNRVTTTGGDKIEVIQGNYKMVVLGREKVPTPPAKAVPLGRCYAASSQTNLEQLLKDWYAATTQTAKDAIVISNVTVDGTTYDKSDMTLQFTYERKLETLAGTAFITDVSGGHFQEQYPTPSVCYKTVEWQPSTDGVSRWTLFQSNQTAGGNIITELGLGDIEDRFYVTSKKTRIGKQSQRVPLDDYTWAKAITGTVDAESITSTTKVSGTVESTTTADKVISTTNVGDTTVYSEINKGGLGNIISMTKAGSISNLSAAFHILDMSIGLRTAITVALAREIYLFGKASLCFGVYHDVRIGPKDEFVTSGTNTLVIGTDRTISETICEVGLAVFLGI
jgi:hypothetical protein